MKYAKLGYAIKFNKLYEMNNKFLWCVDEKNGSFIAIMCGIEEYGFIMLTENGIRFMRAHNYGETWIAYKIQNKLVEGKLFRYDGNIDTIQEDI